MSSKFHDITLWNTKITNLSWCYDFEWPILQGARFLPQILLFESLLFVGKYCIQDAELKKQLVISWFLHWHQNKLVFQMQFVCKYLDGCITVVEQALTICRQCNVYGFQMTSRVSRRLMLKGQCSPTNFNYKVICFCSAI